MSGNLTEKENLVRPGESIVHCNEWKVLYISDDLKDFGFNISVFCISLYGMFAICKKITKLKTYMINHN